jgi:hypothetical protein
VAQAVPESTLTRPISPGPGVSEGAGRGGPTARGLIRSYPAVLTGVGLLAISTVIVLWARTRPGFDPYGWLVWGHQTVIWGLNTNAAPSWKPLPYLFTTPYALAGHYELWLWMITSVAVSLSGVIFAGRIAYRLTAADTHGRYAGDTQRRYAAIAAAVFAGAALLGITDYWHYILSSQSDPMIVALVLGAIDCHLSGRRRWAFVLGALASLGRPEVWPFLALYSIWAWRRVPSMRWLIGGGVVVILLLWFGIPALTSRTPFVAASNALGSGRALHNDKIFGTIGRFFGLHTTIVELLALLSVAVAVWRRDRVTLALALGVVAWVIVEIAFALHGWPGLARYMFEAAGVTVVLAGVGFGRLLIEPPRVSRAAGWAGIAVAVVIVGILLPSAISRARSEHSDIVAQRRRTDQINRLAGTIRRLGGAARLQACGEPLTRLEYQTTLAYELGVNVATVGYKYGQAVGRGNPVVLFTPTDNGWDVKVVHQRLPVCRGLPH